MPCRTWGILTRPKRYSWTCLGCKSAERIGKFVGFGDGLPKPDQAFFPGADTSHLSIVAAAA